MPWPYAALLVKAIVRPETLVKEFLRRFPLGSFEFRLALEGFDRPWYAYGIYASARLCKRLGQTQMCVIEFGVAGGDGLVVMERLASEVSRILGVGIQVFGFDTGQGMPAHSDYRDLPYVWRKGLYRMDVAAVKRRLASARLILGDVRETIPEFLKTPYLPPIGFVSFDLDYYTSMTAALPIFEGPDHLYLPRVLCYFDDIRSGEQQYHCEDVGELLAIREFNGKAGRNHRIRPNFGLSTSFPLSSPWACQLWTYHRYDHQNYNTYIGI